MKNEELVFGNDIIFRTMSCIDLFYKKLSGNSPRSKSYYEKILFFQEIKDVKWPYSAETSRTILHNLLRDAEIPLLKENVYKIQHPDADLSTTDRSLIEAADIRTLTDTEIVNYFGLYCRTVTFVEKDDLVLLKYSPAVYETGWNKFALMSRGKVIDRKYTTLVTYPFDKFFNLNEVEITKEKNIRNLISTAKSVYVSDKKDGTMIAVSNYHGKPLITTTGSFDNIYIDIADKLLQKHAELYNNFPTGYTMMFELIAPESHQCVYYGDERKLILIGIRSHETLNLLSRNDMEDMAKDYGLEITEAEPLGLDEMISRIGDTDVNKEGWVIRICQANGSERIVKLKYDEYFKLHAIHSGISQKRLYNQYVFEDIEKHMGRMAKGTQEAVLSLIEQININRSKIEEAAIALAKECCNDLGIDIKKEIDREEQFTVHKYLSSITGKRAALCPLAIKYIRTKSLKYAFFNLRYEKYIAMVEALTQEDHRG